VVVSQSDTITTQDLPFQVREEAGESTVRAGKAAGPLPAMLSEIERDLIIKALEKTGGVQTKAAQSLGLSERVLRYKMQKHGLSVK
jgi:two-component system NtrC family response regulator